MNSSGLIFRIGSRVAVLGVAVLLALGAAEIALRVAGLGKDQLLRSDPVLGLRYISGKSGVNRGGCFRSTVTINSHGWRSGETRLEKPEGVFRILVLGDSIMAGLEVNDNEIFSAAIEKLLNGAGLPKRIEVINLGVPSFGTDQEYVALRRFGRAYDPDFVLLAIFSLNDIRNNALALNRPSSVNRKPYFDIEDGRLVALPYRDSTPVAKRILQRAIQPFRLYPWVRDTLSGNPIAHGIMYKLGLTAVPPPDRAAAKPGGRIPSRWEPHFGVFKRNYDATWTHAWDITKALVRRIGKEAGEMGAGFVAFGIADPVTVLPVSMRSEELSPSMLAVSDLDKPMRLLAQFSSSSAIDFLSLVPAFRARIGDSGDAFEKLFLYCDGHWTPAGHRLAAETVAAHLKPILKDRMAK